MNTLYMSADQSVKSAVTQSEHTLGITPGYSVMHRRRFVFTLEKLNKKIPPSSTTRVADLGVWPGYQSLALHNAGYQVTGFDLKPDRLPSLPFPVFQQDFNQTPELQTEPKSFQTVIATEIIEHLSPDIMPQFIAGIHKSLAPGGCVLLTTPNRNYLGSLFKSRVQGTDTEGHGHTHEYTVSELRKLFNEDWTDISVQSFDAYRGVGTISTTEYYLPLWRWWQHPRKIHNLVKLLMGIVQFIFPPVRDSIVVMTRRNNDA